MEVSNLSLVYLLNHLGRRVLDFFRHWYFYGFLRTTHWSYNILERLDRIFALRITVKNWLQPLYQDYSFIGYLWGFIFRTARILAALAVYGIFLILAIGLFLFWSAIPILVIYNILTNLWQ